MKIKIAWAAVEAITPFVSLGILVMMLCFGELDNATKNYYSVALAVLVVAMIPFVYYSKMSLATIMKVLLKK